jgi:hypothetical protein
MWSSTGHRGRHRDRGVQAGHRGPDTIGLVLTMLGVMRISVDNGIDCVTTNVEHKMGLIPHPEHAISEVDGFGKPR